MSTRSAKDYEFNTTFLITFEGTTGHFRTGEKDRFVLRREGGSSDVLTHYGWNHERDGCGERLWRR